MGIRLHVGGQTPVPGWTIVNVVPAPHVDIIADCVDLGVIADGSCSIVYASHVVEHLGYDAALPKALAEFFRVLEPGGKLMVSVPDLDVLCRLFVHPAMTPNDRFHVMRMMFGGRVDAHDVHQTGLNAEFLGSFLTGAGFRDIRRVQGFGLFNDTSTLMYKGNAISVNLTALKPT